MIDGPGPPGTDTAAVRALPARVALMTSGPGPVSGSLDTQRILLVLFCSGGACNLPRGGHAELPSGGQRDYFT